MVATTLPIYFKKRCFNLPLHECLIFFQEEVEMEDIAEEPVIDIDSCDKKNPLAVPEYIDDIYAYYKKVEVDNYPMPLVKFIYLAVELSSKLCFG